MDKRYLTMHEAAQQIGCTTRWMRRHYVDLIRQGVEVFRVPKDSTKGRLLFGKGSLNQYMEQCRIEGNFETLG